MNRLIVQYLFIVQENHYLRMVYYAENVNKKQSMLMKILPGWLPIRTSSLVIRPLIEMGPMLSGTQYSI